MNNLTSLDGCPIAVNGSFHCNYNKLTSLQFCPQIIKGDFYCSDNRITDLIHFPSHINGGIYLGNNSLIEIDMNKFYNFKELYGIHIEHKILAEKEILADSIGPNVERTPIKIKI